jgi:hypothetical protein
MADTALSGQSVGAASMTNMLLQEDLCGLQVTRICEFPNIRRREALVNNYAHSKLGMYLPNSAKESIKHQLEIYGHISR